MLRLKIETQDGLHYWTITRNGEPVCAGTRGFPTFGDADADARTEWDEYTGGGTPPPPTPLVVVSYFASYSRSCRGHTYEHGHSSLSFKAADTPEEAAAWVAAQLRGREELPCTHYVFENFAQMASLSDMSADEDYGEDSVQVRYADYDETPEEEKRRGDLAARIRGLVADALGDKSRRAWRAREEARKRREAEAYAKKLEEDRRRWEAERPERERKEREEADRQRARDEAEYERLKKKLKK